MQSKFIPAFLIWFALLLGFCKANRNTHTKRQEQAAIVLPAPGPEDVKSIPLPDGFFRKNAEPTSFDYWLRQQQLKKDNTVYLFDGSKKANQEAQYAVLNISVGTQNLQQCADAAMRLRAEYLYSIEKFDAIRFTDNDGKVYQFTKPYSLQHLHSFLQQVFGMCGTASLSKQMRPVKLVDIEPGDVLIRGGFPGHAAIVADVAINNSSHRIYLLAQSYMPAQDIHILKNPANAGNDPWYRITDDGFIETPEYVFKSTELKRW